MPMSIMIPIKLCTFSEVPVTSKPNATPIKERGIVHDHFPFADFINANCKEAARVARLAKNFTQLLSYVATTSMHSISPAEAKYLIVHTYMVLAEIFSLKAEAKP